MINTLKGYGMRAIAFISNISYYETNVNKVKTISYNYLIKINISIEEEIKV